MPSFFLPRLATCIGLTIHDYTRHTDKDSAVIASADEFDDAGILEDFTLPSASYQTNPPATTTATTDTAANTIVNTSNTSTTTSTAAKRILISTSPESRKRLNNSNKSNDANQPVRGMQVIDQANAARDLLSRRERIGLDQQQPTQATQAQQSSLRRSTRLNNNTNNNNNAAASFQNLNQWRE
ncbi:hypothetical protein HK100_005900 [Physocladia obscura]|uniref:Uncharacterized protein n=1 Tax=Physocladia obscura TaxID=109957 RepID=A0AAD5T6B5_9FUNG|nr:hypothetical protein HK100_005900 [Physocladia obscura]